MERQLATWPWHAGEIAMQETIGVVERMKDVGRRVIRDHMPDQHREFYEQLPFLVLGSVGADGVPFASIVAGPPGFAWTPDAKTLVLKHDLPISSCAASGLTVGASVGVLGIELHTRRRNRVNGRITAISDRRLEIAVEHSFGNCPKYIQLKNTRSWATASGPSYVSYRHHNELSDLQRLEIRRSDTMFVATYVDLVDEAGQSRRQVDVSHRGGKPGFVHVAQDGTITIPDFVGNNFFNTLGNITVNPRAGLLFVNFEEGSTLQVEGSAEIVTGGPEVTSYHGAERIWRVRPRNICQSLGRAMPLAFSQLPDGLSPYLLETGEWPEGDRGGRQTTSLWTELRVERIEKENSHTSSFYLVSSDGAPLPRSKAGQHISLRLPGTPEFPPLVKTYTVSSRPDAPYYRISVKKQGAGSTAIHERLTVGAMVEASRPAGSFTLPENTDGDLVFLAGGIGITPILAMLYELEERVEDGAKVGRATVVYAVSRAADFALLAELQAIARRLAGKVNLIRLVSRTESTENNFSYDATGRLRGTLLADFELTTKTHAFVCGPDGFMRSANDILQGLGLPAENIHTEAFGIHGQQAGSEFHMLVSGIGRAGVPTPVRLNRSGVDAVWEPESGTLLEFIESLGIQPDFSCRSGTCGTCRTRLLSGSVHGPVTDRTADGTADVLICSAYPADAGDMLVLDL